MATTNCYHLTDRWSYEGYRFSNKTETVNTYDSKNDRYSTTTLYKALVFDLDGVKVGEVYYSLADRQFVTAEYQLLNNKRHGRFYEYHYGYCKRMAVEGTYHNGRLQGTYKKYDITGRVSDSLNWHDNLPHGTWVHNTTSGHCTTYEYQHGQCLSSSVPVSCT